MAASKRASKIERRFKQLLAEMLRMHLRKNADYAGPLDPLANLRVHGEYGVVVRLTDKILRLQSFFDPKTGTGRYRVKDEKVLDTCLDLSVYGLLLVILHEEKQRRR